MVVDKMHARAKVGGEGGGNNSRARVGEEGGVNNSKAKVGGEGGGNNSRAKVGGEGRGIEWRKLDVGGARVSSVWLSSSSFSTPCSTPSLPSTLSHHISLDLSTGTTFCVDQATDRRKVKVSLLRIVPNVDLKHLNS